MVKDAEMGPRLNIKYGFNWASKKTIYGWTLTKIEFFSKVIANKSR
jgi:hypothetical protein